MKKVSVLVTAVLALIVACGTSTEPGTTILPRKLDPYITIRVRDQMDTTTLSGRAHWHIYLLLTGPNVNLNGIAPQGTASLEDIRLSHNRTCVGASADSIGQRLVSVVAFADTTTSDLTLDATARSIVDAWYAGNHTLPAGWKALFNPAVDAWDSQQFANGHGLTRQDPIKWGLDWLGAGTVDFYERPGSDTTSFCNSF
jgi:hypothetical protein